MKFLFIYIYFCLILSPCYTRGGGYNMEEGGPASAWYIMKII